ncbi:Uncharacterized membrane-anchored protein YhcB, DUF1043 family [Ruminobacter amylophilus]|jgi:uncharacterized membrane-anchored protein YhcB (DUF1043 family)|uniref:Z-ring associated protein G n=1 Tax=Ruminobacter amylophilus TaxID=867 RepID=A0A662ZGZ7_9GAMM|nr:DUF1043 family protein [Ruminobacter amylophilus]SFP34764.1 Uncharacterized membrane-anchored protein YhcB, DUF1043 family [Ruminobacter amylophilus]
MDNTTTVYIILSAVLGVIVGFLLRHFLIRDASKMELQDELTKAQREMATQKRILTDFFQTSGTLFDQLENSYATYARFMNEQSKKIIPQFGNMYETSHHDVYHAPHQPEKKEKPVIDEAEVISEDVHVEESSNNN